ncbi:MAG: YdbH domain-containing protein [Candidatus Didemnitutus sp.]|nr:YdbH domain-containing protein [Candidatus Didemnitutus sp.]
MSAVPVVTRRRWIVRLIVAFVVLVTALVLVRRPLAGAAIAATLKMVGAGDVKLDVTQASPWRVEVADLGFRVRAQRFDAKRVTLDRRHWWSPSFASIRVEGAKVPVTVDGSDTNPWQWASYSGGGGGTTTTLAVPAEEVSIDGVLVVQAAGEQQQDVRVQFAVKPAGKDRWSGDVNATAPGFAAKIGGEFNYASGTWKFQVADAQLDLAQWQDFIGQMVVLPGGKWSLAGKLRGSATGAYAGGKLALAGDVELSDARFEFPARNVVADGVSAKFHFRDLDKFISEPGDVHVASLTAGEIKTTNLELQLAFDTVEKIAVSHATLEAFGGRLAAEPFRFFPRQNELEAVLLVDGLVVEQLLALARDVPAKATGRVDGRVPLRIDGAGIRFGTGWLELKRGVYAEVQFNADGLLTSGVAPNSAQYTVMKKIEAGLLRLKLAELRLDIRPPKAPPGRSAIVHLAGSPVDPEVKAPVTLDLNVNGPFESLLNLGLNSRVSFGGK